MRAHDAWRAAAAIAVLIIGSSAPALAIELGGIVVDEAQFATVDGPAGQRALVVDGPVYMGDVIRTGPKGLAQIRLRDDTKLVVGPSSYMRVDKFVFSGNKASAINLNAVRGAFRFITGVSVKKAYEIKTPSATIGVRGTRFDFSIDRRGRMAIALYEGAAQLCNRRKECFVVSGTCSVALTQRFRKTQPLSAEERQRLLATAFPFVDNQTRLTRAFRINTSGCDIRHFTLTRDAAGRIIRVPAGSSGGGPGSASSFGSFGSFSSFGSVGGTSGATGANSNNRSGLADNTNPGAGSSNSNASSGGTSNPGGGGGAAAVVAVATATAMSSTRTPREGQRFLNGIGRI